MSRALEDGHRVLDLPVNVVKAVDRLKQVEEEMTIDLGRVPLDREIAEELEITEEKLKELRIYGKSVVHLSQLVKDDTELGDLIADKYNLEESVMIDLMRDELAEAISTLNDTEQMIIRARFGFDGEVMTLTELAKVLKVSASTVRTYERNALEKLRTKFPSLAEY